MWLLPGAEDAPAPRFETPAPQSHQPTPVRRTWGQHQRPSATELGSIRSTRRRRFSEQSAQQASDVDSAHIGARKPRRSAAPPAPLWLQAKPFASASPLGTVGSAESSTRSSMARAATSLAEAVSSSRHGTKEATRPPTALCLAAFARRVEAAASASNRALSASSGDSASSVASASSSSSSTAYRAKISSNLSLKPFASTFAAPPATSAALASSSSAVRESTSASCPASPGTASTGNSPKALHRQPHRHRRCRQPSVARPQGQSSQAFLPVSPPPAPSQASAPRQVASHCSSGPHGSGGPKSTGAAGASSMTASKAWDVPALTRSAPASDPRSELWPATSSSKHAKWARQS
mmetsp:Transcript_115898/g.300447  ORF Transcript_115898/g.300447 Transcript_115898/m.300447 type:complete len:351 (-) Transcript_115898:288-1340(-)